MTSDVLFPPSTGIANQDPPPGHQPFVDQHASSPHLSDPHHFQLHNLTRTSPNDVVGPRRLRTTFASAESAVHRPSPGSHSILRDGVDSVSVAEKHESPRFCARLGGGVGCRGGEVRNEGEGEGAVLGEGTVFGGFQLSSCRFHCESRGRRLRTVQSRNMFNNLVPVP